MSETATYTLTPGTTPLLVSVPHVGTAIPEDIGAALVPRALAREDTDWHLDEVYAFARELGAGLLVPRYSRYVIDLNRPPENAPMYPGANNTELVPTRFFSGDPLYREGRVPDEAEVARRRDAYWRPYHEALAGELVRSRSSGTATASRPSCRGSFPDAYPTSTSAPPPARAARRRCARR
jgi:N-formylglutamate deformylase